MLSSLLQTTETLLENDRRRKLDLQRAREARIPTRLEELEYDDFRDTLADGCAVADKMLEDFAMFDDGIQLGRERIVRFKYQREIHIRTFAALMNVILGADAAYYEPELRARYGIKSIHRKLLAVMMSRRMGKTMACVMLVVAGVRNIKSFKALIIANSFRASRSFNEQIALMLRELGHTKLEPENDRSVGIHMGPGDHRIVHALPGSVPDLLRGIGGDLIILEEAAFVPVRTFREIVVPLLRMQKTCIVAISTLGSDGNNYYTKILKMDLFDKIIISLICEECEAKGVEEVCEHRKDLRPPWHDKENDDQLKQLIDDPETYARENLGVMGRKEIDPHIFTPELIDAFLRKPRLPFRAPIRFIFLLVDS